MKELKFFQEELRRLHREDEERSYAPVNDKLEYKYNSGYSYEDNRKRIHEIHVEEMKIRTALAKFNAVTKADGLDMTISEALVRIAQLRDEIKALMSMTSRPEIYTEDRYSGGQVTYKIMYDLNMVKDDLAKAQRELANIQMAVDRTNLTALVKY